MFVEAVVPRRSPSKDRDEARFSTLLKRQSAEWVVTVPAVPSTVTI